MAITTIKLPVSRMRRAVAGTFTVALACAGASQAAEWKVVPSVNLTETYTDNVRLTARGTEQSDFVTQVAPGLSVTNDSPRLQVRASYALQALFYKNTDVSPQFTNMVNATIHAVLVQDMLELDARGSVGQQNISAFGPISTSNVNVTNNRSNVRSYSISPYLVRRFDNVATGQLRYTHESVSTGNLNGASNTTFGNTLGNSNTDRLALNLDSGPKFRTLTWGARASTSKTQYSSTTSVDQSVYSGNLGYLLTPAFRLTATGGYEKNTYITFGEQPQGGFYTAGFIWTPSTRTNVTTTVGHRYFGRTYGLAISERLRNAAVTVSYTEDISSSQAQALAPQLVDTAALLNQTFQSSIPDPVARQRVVDALILQNGLSPTQFNPVNSLTNQYFLQKSFQASIALNGRRNTIVGTVFDTRRLPQSQQGATLGAQVGTFDSNTRQIGTTGLWSLQLSPRTSANANLSYTRSTSLTTTQQNTYKTARIGMATAFQPKLRGTVELRHSQQGSDFLSGDIRENAITAALLMQF